MRPDAQSIDWSIMTRRTHGVLSSVLWMEGASADKLVLRRVAITSSSWGDGGD